MILLSSLHSPSNLTFYMLHDDKSNLFMVVLIQMFLQKQESESGTTEDPSDDSAPFEFPVANLFELENRVFTESWSIPYKREESLGKCLLASTKLAEAGGYFYLFIGSNVTVKKPSLVAGV